LRESIERSPRSIALREKMRDICVSQKNLNEAARHCLALVSLYIGREDFDLAYDRLQEAKLLDRAFRSRPDSKRFAARADRNLQQTREKTPQKVRTDVTFAGNLAYVSIFDAVQVIEKLADDRIARYQIRSSLASVSFNEGKIVDAECSGHNGVKAFREIIEINSGTFEFTTAENEFTVVINVSSNTNFLLDVLTELDNERAEKQGLRNLNDEDF
jgi:hypothetical protein